MESRKVREIIVISSKGDRECTVELKQPLLYTHRLLQDQMEGLAVRRDVRPYSSVCILKGVSQKHVVRRFYDTLTVLWYIDIFDHRVGANANEKKYA